MGYLVRGGMAAVYRALDTVLRREIALKVLYPHYLSDQEQIARFQREAVVAASLDHPNIVQMYDVGNEQGLIYIAMQLLPGRTLGDLLRERGTLPLDQLAPIVDQVASALDYAHARGIIHRDIKPANILIDSDGRAVLTDFGIAKLLDTPGLTTTSVIVGTPDYMAPEQIGGQAVDGRVDIYALGVLVFRALSGRRPFEGGTDQVLLGHLNGSVPNVSAYTAGLPNGVDAVVQRAMARRPEDRYQTASALAADLRSVAGLPPLRTNRQGNVATNGQAQTSNGAPVVRGAAADAATVRQTTVPAQGSTVQAAPPVAVAPRRNRVLLPLSIALLLAVAVGCGFVIARTFNTVNSGVAVLPTAPATAAPSAAPTAEAPAPTAVPGAATSEPSAAPSGVPTATTVPPTARPTRVPTARPTAAPAPTMIAAPSAPTTPPATVAPPTPTTSTMPILALFKPTYDASPKLRERLGAISSAAPDVVGAEQGFEFGGMLWSGLPDDTIYVLKSDKTWNKFSKSQQKGPDTPPTVTPTQGRLIPVSGFGTVWSTHSELPLTLGFAINRESNIAFAYQRFQGGEMLYSASGFGKGKTIYALYSDNGQFEEFAAN